jgi:hypothetical protein
LNRENTQIESPSFISDNASRKSAAQNTFQCCCARTGIATATVIVAMRR